MPIPLDLAADAVEAGAQQAAVELGGVDLRPGMVLTDLLSGSEMGVAWTEEMKRRIDPLTADDVAEVIAFAVGRPRHVSLPEILLMPAKQL